MPFTQQILQKLEYDIALTLIKKTYYQEIDEKKCSEIAKKVLELLPENSDLETIKKSLLKLKESYFNVLSQIITKYLEIIANRETEEQINQVKQKINHILYGSRTNRN
jgi:uncharacterized membrane-anchored protein YjiN (DUF445 family)